MESTVTNNIDSRFYPNRIEIRGSINDTDNIGSVYILDTNENQNPFNELAVVNIDNFGRIQIGLSPKPGLQRGLYDSVLWVYFCTDLSCDTTLDNSPYIVDYTFDFYPDAIELLPSDNTIVDITHINSSQTQAYLGLITEESENPSPIEFTVNLPKEYSSISILSSSPPGFDLTNIHTESFELSPLNTSIGLHSGEFNLEIQGEDTATKNMAINIEHIVVPVGFDTGSAKILTEGPLHFSSVDEIQTIEVFKPLEASLFSEDIRIDIIGDACRWLRIITPSFLSIEDAGINSIDVYVDDFFGSFDLTLGLNTCHISAEYNGETLGTIEVNYTYTKTHLD